MINYQKTITLHIELEKEYTRLSLQPQNKETLNRMVEIQEEISLLKEQEATWSPECEKMKTDLNMVTQEELAEMINATPQTIINLRELGIIKPIKTGRNFMFTIDEIKKFQKDYLGLDVSNRVKAKEALNIVNTRL